MTAVATPTIRLTGISKSFPGIKSLDAVDFEVHGGEIHALVGENGAGKSTLTKIIGGALAADEGRIEFGGRTVTWQSPRQAREAGIHIIYQEFALFPELSVAENIMVGKLPRGPVKLIDRRRMVAESAAILARLNATIDPRARVGGLSVADQQLVEIAKALVGDLRILVLDEPTAVISGREVDVLFENMRRLRAAGVAIVYISHRLEEIFEIADRVTVLKDGKLVATRESGSLDRHELIGLMVGRRIDAIYPAKPAGQAPGPVVLAVEHAASGSRVLDASLELHAGEILGVAGMVGAGRTELAHAIFGSAALVGGRITVAGKPVAGSTSPLASIRRGMGFLTEDRKLEGLFLQLSVAANIMAPSLREIARSGFLDRKQEDGIGSQEIKKFTIAVPSPRTRVGALSGGNQQKVLFSRWTRIAHKVLLLDEPTRGVDVGAKVEIYRIIRELADRGLGILLISSELPEIIGMSDRIVVMREGRTAGELTGEEMTEENVLRLAVLESWTTPANASLEAAAEPRP